MTVQTSDRKESFAGGQGSLSFSFKTIPSHPEHIKVTVNEIATDTETDLTYDSDFTVSLASNGIGGVVTVSPSYSTAYTYTVYRDTTKTQESDYDDYNQFPADTLENDLDRLMCLTQEIAEEVSRSIRNPITNSSAVTLAQIQSYASTASAAATAAEASESAASDSETNAAASEAAAAGYAAGLNLPSISTGSAYSVLQVNSDEDAYQHAARATMAEAAAGTDHTVYMTPSSCAAAIAALQDDDIPLSYLSTDSTMAGTSATVVPSQGAVYEFGTGIIVITSGTIAHGGTIPYPALPSGKDSGDYNWHPYVSINNIGSYTGGDGDNLQGIYCSVNTSTLAVTCYGKERDNGTTNGTANFMMIGILK